MNQLHPAVWPAIAAVIGALLTWLAQRDVSRADAAAKLSNASVALVNELQEQNAALQNEISLLREENRKLRREVRDLTVQVDRLQTSIDRLAPPDGQDQT